MKEIRLEPPRPANPEARKPARASRITSSTEGPYATAYAKLAATGLRLDWQSAPAGQQAKAKKASKTKFSCPECGQNAWAKPDAQFLCSDCYEDGQGDICLMIAQPPDAEAP